MKQIFSCIKKLEVSTGLVLVAVVLWMQFTTQPHVRGFIDRLENLAYDFRYVYSLNLQSALDSKIIIIDIDEKSLQQEGRWPWPRKKLAQLIENLVASGVVVVGVDMVFSEKQQNIGKMVLERMQQNENSALIAGDKKTLHNIVTYFDDDAIFAESFKKTDVVLGYMLYNKQHLSSGILPQPVVKLPVDARTPFPMLHATSHVSNIKMLQRAAKSAGFITAVRDADGIIRRTPLVMRLPDGIYSSFALEIVKSYLLADNINIITNPIGEVEYIDEITLDSVLRIATDAYGRILIPFRGKAGSYPYFSGTDIINGDFNIKDIAGKIALIGTSALGLADLQSTAVQAVFPGVEVHANIIDGLLNNKFPYVPPWTHGIEFALIGLLGVACAIFFPMWGPKTIAFVGTTIIFSEICINLWLWVYQGISLIIMMPIVMVILLLTTNLFYGFILEKKKKKQITNIFGQYVSKDVVAQMLKDPDSYKCDGESKVMTALFADIRNFTTIAESLPASKVRELLNRFFAPMTKIIFLEQGTIDKYIGDMIMAFWGAPKDDPLHTQRAVCAGFQMLEQARLLKDEFKQLGLPEINIGIGINTGVMHVGDMGSIYRRSYTVLGDAVNLGARLEGSTKFYAVNMIIGEEAYKNLDGTILCRQLDVVKVKGKEKPIAIYEPVCQISEANNSLIEAVAKHNEAINLYFQQQWDAAQAHFVDLHAKHPEVKLYSMYLERISRLKQCPPGVNWDGSYMLNDK